MPFAGYCQACYNERPDAEGRACGQNPLMMCNKHLEYFYLFNKDHRHDYFSHILDEAMDDMIKAYEDEIQLRHPCLMFDFENWTRGGQLR